MTSGQPRSKTLLSVRRLVVRPRPLFAAAEPLIKELGSAFAPNHPPQRRLTLLSRGEVNQRLHEIDYLGSLPTRRAVNVAEQMLGDAFHHPLHAHLGGFAVEQTAGEREMDRELVVLFADSRLERERAAARRAVEQTIGQELSWISRDLVFRFGTMTAETAASLTEDRLAEFSAQLPERIRLARGDITG